jgi:hypothetical protein
LSNFYFHNIKICPNVSQQKVIPKLFTTQKGITGIYKE